MTREQLITRGKELETQRAQARQQLANAQHQVIEADRLIWAVDGAIQQNNYWINIIDEEERAAEKEPSPEGVKV